MARSVAPIVYNQKANRRAPMSQGPVFGIPYAVAFVIIVAMVRNPVAKKNPSCGFVSECVNVPGYIENRAIRSAMMVKKTIMLITSIAFPSVRIASDSIGRTERVKATPPVDIVHANQAFRS